MVYEYYLETGDLEFVCEAFPVMEDVVFWYQKGTDFHIKMDSDGLIMAGGGLEQVTWMDVRIDKGAADTRVTGSRWRLMRTGIMV